MIPQQLLAQCRDGAHLLHEAHAMAAKRYEAVTHMLGLAVITLAAAAGAGVLHGLPARHSSAWVIVTGMAAVAAAAVAAVQTFLAYPGLAERHRSAALRYGDLRREFDRLLVFLGPEVDLEPRVARLQAGWNEIDRAAPAIPQRVMRRTPRRMERRQRKLASIRSKIAAADGQVLESPAAIGN